MRVEMQHESRSLRTRRRPAVDAQRLAVVFVPRVRRRPGASRDDQLRRPHLRSRPRQRHRAAGQHPVREPGRDLQRPERLRLRQADGDSRLRPFGDDWGRAVPTSRRVGTPAKLVATFTAPQRDVGAWVGYSYKLTEPLGVRLTAFDANDAIVGTDDATLPGELEPDADSDPPGGEGAAAADRQARRSR